MIRNRSDRETTLRGIMTLRLPRSTLCPHTPRRHHRSPKRRMAATESGDDKGDHLTLHQWVGLVRKNAFISDETEGRNQSMSNVEDLFILSDLHLSARRGAGLFQADAELAACLGWILTNTRDSLIVLAGDVLDFLVLSDEDRERGFYDLGERTQEIISSHPEVFKALARLAQSRRHRMVIMGGDHDPELIFPTVQEAIENGLGIHFNNSTIRWLVQGEALRLRVGNAVVLIEHGNSLDPWNRINHSHLRGALSLASRNLLQPIRRIGQADGTLDTSARSGAFSYRLLDGGDYELPLTLGGKLALAVVHELRDRYRWVDCLEPKTEAILPLLWPFASSTQQTHLLNLVDEYSNLRNKALNEKIGNLRKPERLYSGEKETARSPSDQALEAWAANAREQRRPASSNKQTGEPLIGGLKSISARDDFFEIGKPDDAAVYLRPQFEGGADLIIHGHTHSAKAVPLEGGLYVNTGTWGQLLHLPKSKESLETWQAFLGRLETNDVPSIRRPTFARVQHRKKQNVTTATLLEWQQPRPDALAERRFTDRLGGWRKEG
jgi:UDP-2,3-diacylglucosamine pyrophosphatase LpxH